MVLAYLCNIYSTNAQYKSEIRQDTVPASEKPIQVFTDENIDLFSNGIIRSTTNILNFNIGRSDKFYLPLYLAIGTTADLIPKDNFLNEELIFDLLNINGGLINGGYKLSLSMIPSDGYAQLNFIHQLSAKSISGVNFETSDKDSFLSFMGVFGLMLYVNAWSPDEKNQNGHFWVNTSLSISKNPQEVLENLLRKKVNDMLLALQIESGINLSEDINIKVGYYRFMNNLHIEGFDVGQFKLTGLYDF
jgi:hypothetical protein